MLTWAILEEPISVVTYGPSFYILQILQTKSRFSFDYMAPTSQAMCLFQYI